MGHGHHHAPPAATASAAYHRRFAVVLGLTVAVLAAAVVVETTGWTAADTVASLLIAALVLPRAWSLLREAVDVLLEAAPRGVDLDDVRARVLGVDGVVGVQGLHAWTITSGLPVLSAHVVVSDEALAGGHEGASGPFPHVTWWDSGAADARQGRRQRWTTGTTRACGCPRSRRPGGGCSCRTWTAIRGWRC